MNQQDLKKYMRSQKIKYVIAGTAVFAGFLLFFHTGTEVGYRKALFESKVGEKYLQTFAPKGEHRMIGFFPDAMPGSHGTAGKIASISLPTMIVEDFDGTEKVVRFTNDTVVRKFRDTLNQTELRSGDYVVVIGTPTATGEVEAKLIRIMPTQQPQ